VGGRKPPGKSNIGVKAGKKRRGEAQHRKEPPVTAKGREGTKVTLERPWKKPRAHLVREKNKKTVWTKSKREKHTEEDR